VRRRCSLCAVLDLVREACDVRDRSRTVTPADSPDGIAQLDAGLGRAADEGVVAERVRGPAEAADQREKDDGRGERAAYSLGDQPADDRLERIAHEDAALHAHQRGQHVLGHRCGVGRRLCAASRRAGRT